ncbi:MAG: hypothetical protein P8X57_05085 [Cyclobacteriaceae bacterium]
MKGRTKLVILGLTSLISWILAFLLPQFPWTIVVAVAPLFAIYDHHKSRRLPFVQFGIWTVVILVLVFGILSSIKENWASLPLSVNYGILMSFAFFAYWLTDTYARNRLGLFTMIIYITGLEYVGLLFVPDFAFMLLGSSFSGFPSIQQWNAGTGITGVSMWIIAANIASYHILFRDDAVFKGLFRWRTLLASGILLMIPALISVWFYNEAVVLEPVVIRDAFDEIWSEKNFASAGEITGRTCAWVSVFIVLYGLVQRKIVK